MKNNKKTILIYTIMRNSEKNLNYWYSNIKKIINTYQQDFNFLVSVYENDSSDNTKKRLKKLNWNFVESGIVTENIQTKFYGSVQDADRVKNLADARNKAISYQNFFHRCDQILAIESDVQYDIESVGKLLYFQETYNLEKVDIVSAVSWKKNNDGKKVYDTWGTRRNEREEFGNLHKGWNNHPYQKYYGTFNCLCLMNSQPFKEGVRYHWYNNRLKKFDCDTMVLCEEFHKKNCSEIFINYQSECYS